MLLFALGAATPLAAAVIVQNQTQTVDQRVSINDSPTGGNQVGFATLVNGVLSVTFDHILLDGLVGLSVFMPTLEAPQVSPIVLQAMVNQYQLNPQEAIAQLQGYGNSLLVSFSPQNLSACTDCRVGQVTLTGYVPGTPVAFAGNGWVQFVSGANSMFALTVDGVDAPEPATFLLLGAGFLLIAALRRRTRT